MSDWAGLGYDGMPVVHGFDGEDNPKWYSKQLALTPKRREMQRDKWNEGKSEMDLLWDDLTREA